MGVPDILVNNAGSGQWKFLEETSPAEIEAMMALPYFAAAWLTSAFLPAMRQRGSGHIVNISSVASRIVWPGATAYTAARWAMRGLSEALRADLRGSGISVTLYESGEIESPATGCTILAVGSEFQESSKMLPALKVEDVGAAVVAGVRSDKRLVVIPFAMRIIYALHYLFPWAVQGLMTATGYRFPSAR